MSLPIRTARDAEALACACLQQIGFSDATLTNNGPDGGVDVRASRVVAQVKAQVIPVGRDKIQQLKGCAAAENKLAAFFALGGYTPPARAWADQHNVALFIFNLANEVEALNAIAAKLVDSQEGVIGIRQNKELRKQWDRFCEFLETNNPIMSIGNADAEFTEEWELSKDDPEARNGLINKAISNAQKSGNKCLVMLNSDGKSLGVVWCDGGTWHQVSTDERTQDHFTRFIMESIAKATMNNKLIHYPAKKDG